ITDCGLVNLAAQPESFKRSIEELNLSFCYKVTDLGLSKLLPELKRLRVLNLKISEDVDGAVSRCNSHCSVKSYRLKSLQEFSPVLKYLGSGCHEVTSKTLETVKTYCPKLRYLRISWGLYTSYKSNLLDTLPLLKLASDFDEDYNFFLIITMMILTIPM
ncbi:hypothetical protein QYM36_005189, partial [Artemia franciscana]